MLDSCESSNNLGNMISDPVTKYYIYIMTIFDFIYLTINKTFILID